MARRRYSDVERAEALALLDANGGALRETARATGVPVATLQGWRDGAGVPSQCTELRTEKRTELADRFEALVHLVLDKLPSKLDAATAAQLATVFGVAYDKMRLARGEATSITRMDMSTDERVQRLAEILDAGADRGGMAAPHVSRADGGAGASGGAPVH